MMLARLVFTSFTPLLAALGLLVSLGVAGSASAQSSEPTIRDLLLSQLSAAEVELLGRIAPPGFLDLPASSLGGYEDPTAELQGFYEELRIDGENLDDSGAGCQLGLGAAYSSQFLAAIFDPTQLVDLSAHYTNLGLKTCAPVLKTPPDFGLDPGGACTVTVAGQRTHERVDKIFFADFPARAESWGGLGTPRTDHYNTKMATRITSVRQPGRAATFTSDWNPSLPDDHPDNPSPFQNIELRVGRNEVFWEARSLADMLDFIWIPIPFFPSGSKDPASKKVERTAIRAAGKGLLEMVKGISTEVATEIALNPLDDLFTDYAMSAAVGVTQVVDVYDLVPPQIATNQLDLPVRGHDPRRCEQRLRTVCGTRSKRSSSTPTSVGTRSSSSGRPSSSGR